MKELFAALALVALTACATTGSVFGPTPEAQIVTGANSVNAVATLGTVALKNNKITVAQAKSYSAILHTASAHLDTTNGTLVACRTKTGSTSKSSPDPCAATVADDIALALTMVADVKKILDAKQ
jgi:hypothetical protein